MPLSPSARALIVALGLATTAAGAVMLSPLVTARVDATGRGHTPVTLCHWVPAHGGSYILITVDDDGSSGNGNLQGHEGHEKDIIPAPPEGCPAAVPTPSPTTARATTATAVATSSSSATATSVSTSTSRGHTPVTLCHWVPADGGSYIVITVDDDGSSGNGNLQGHEGHEKDIIPAPPAGCPNPPPTATPTRTVGPTRTTTAVPTSTNTATATRTATPTTTAVPTSTDTPTRTATGTPTAIATSTDTSTATRTATPSATATAVTQGSVTPLPTSSPTPTPTASPTPSAVPTTAAAPPTVVRTATSTATGVTTVTAFERTPRPTPTRVDLVLGGTPVTHLPGAGERDTDTGVLFGLAGALLVGAGIAITVLGLRTRSR